MVHGLSAVFVAVEYCTVAVIRQPFLLSKLDSCLENFAAKLNVFQVVQCGDVQLRNYQDMYWRLRTYVSKGEDVVVFKHHIRLYVASNHFAK